MPFSRLSPALALQPPRLQPRGVVWCARVAMHKYRLISKKGEGFACMKACGRGLSYLQIGVAFLVMMCSIYGNYDCFVRAPGEGVDVKTATQICTPLTFVCASGNVYLTYYFHVKEGEVAQVGDEPKKDEVPEP